MSWNLPRSTTREVWQHLFSTFRKIRTVAARVAEKQMVDLVCFGTCAITMDQLFEEGQRYNEEIECRKNRKRR